MEQNLLLNLMTLEQKVTLALWKADALLNLEDMKGSFNILHDLASNMDTVHRCSLDLQIQFYNNYAIVSLCHGKEDVAITHLQTCVRMHPTCLQAHFNLTLLLLKSNEKEAACITWFTFRNLSLTESQTTYEEMLQELNQQKNDNSQSRISSDHVQTLCHQKDQANTMDAVLITIWKTMSQEKHMACALEIMKDWNITPEDNHIP